MDYHQNARLTIHSREQLARKVLRSGCTLKLAAASFNVSAKTAAKWVRRYQAGGAAGLGPQLQAAALATADFLSLIGKGFVITPGAHARLRNRSPHGSESGFGQPHPAPCPAEPLA